MHIPVLLGGRQQRMSFGIYPEVSLKQARARRDEA
ncbi:Arm DNA-binding domain-containing protein [Pseudomonas sp. DSP3-2-2]